MCAPSPKILQKTFLILGFHADLSSLSVYIDGL